MGIQIRYSKIGIIRRISKPLQYSPSGKDSLPVA